MDLNNQTCPVHNTPFNLIISTANSFNLTCRFCNHTKSGVLLNQSGKMFFLEWTRFLLDLLQSWGAQAILKEINLPFNFVNSANTIGIMAQAIERQVNMFNNNLNYVCSNEMQNLTEHMFVVDYYNMAVGTGDYSLTYLLNNFKALLGEHEGSDINFKPSFVQYLSESRMNILSKFPNAIYSQTAPVSKFKQPYQNKHIVQSESEEMDERIPEEREHRKVITLRKSFIIKPLKNDEKLNLQPRQSISPHRIQVFSGSFKPNNHQSSFQTPKNEGSIKRTRQIFNSQKGNHCKTQESQIHHSSNQKGANESTIYTKKPLQSVHGQRQNNEFFRNNRLNPKNNLKLSVSEFFQKEFHTSPQNKRDNKLSSLSKIAEDIHIENKKLQEWKDDMADHVKELGTKIEQMNVVRESFKENRQRLRQTKEDEKSLIDELSDNCKQKGKLIETYSYPVQTDLQSSTKIESEKLKQQIEQMNQMQRLSEKQKSEKNAVIKRLEMSQLSLRQKLESKQKQLLQVDEQIHKQNQYVHELNKVNLNYLQLIKTKNLQFDTMEAKLSAMDKHKNTRTFCKQVDLHHFNEDSRKGLASAQSYLTELLQKNSQLKGQIEDLEIQKQGCVRAMDLLKNQMKQSNQKLKELQLKVNNSEFYNQSFQDVIGLQQKTISNLEEQLQTKEKMINSLEAIVHSNLKEQEEEGNKRDKQQERYNETGQTINWQHEKMESLAGELEEMKQKCMNQSKQIAGLRQTQQQTNHQSQANLIKYQQQIKESQQKIAMAEQLLVNERVLKEQVQMKLEEQICTCKGKNEELNEKQERILSLEASQRRLKQSIEAHSQELEQQRQKVSKMEIKNKEVLQNLSSEKKQNMKLKQAVKQLQQSGPSYDEQLAEELVLAEVELKSKEVEIQKLNKICLQMLDAVDENKREQFRQGLSTIKK